jgi:hypothetical protein
VLALTMKDVNFLHGLNRSQNKAVSRKTMTVDIGYLAQILCAMPRPQNDIHGEGQLIIGVLAI